MLDYLHAPAPKYGIGLVWTQETIMKTLALCSLMAAIALTGTTAAADFDETKKPLAGDLVKYESLAIASGRPYETIIDGNPGAFLIAAEPVMKDGTCMSGGDANGALSLPETCTG